MSQPLRVVLVDLDHTLVDQTQTPGRVAARLDALLGARAAAPSAREIYLGLHQHQARLQDMGVLDIRRNWLNERALLAVEAVRRADVSPDIQAAWHAFITREGAGDCAADGGNTDAAVAFGQGLARKIDALAAVPSVREDVRSALRSLIAEGDLVVRHDDVEMLMSRLASLAANVYIVTEGDAWVQRFKVEQIGLDRWIPAERVVTTDDLVLPDVAAELQPYHRAVARLLGIGLDDESAARDLSYDAAVLAARMRALGDVRSALHGASVRSAALTPGTPASSVIPMASVIPAPVQLERLQDGLQSLEQILTSVTTKANPRFGRMLLNAIARCPERPHDGVKAIFAGQPGVQALQIMTIGDRFDYDIWPWLSMCGPDVLTVHIRRGKYRAEDWSARRSLANLPAPTFEVASFWELEPELTDASALWARGQPVNLPAIVAPDDRATRLRLEACRRLPRGSLPWRLADVLLA